MRRGDVGRQERRCEYSPRHSRRSPREYTQCRHKALQHGEPDGEKGTQSGTPVLRVGDQRRELDSDPVDRAHDEQKEPGSYSGPTLIGVVRGCRKEPDRHGHREVEKVGAKPCGGSVSGGSDPPGFEMTRRSSSAPPTSTPQRSSGATAAYSPHLRCVVQSATRHPTAASGSTANRLRPHLYCH